MFSKGGILSNQWFSVKEITQLPGMPSSGPGVHKKAKREGWTSRKQDGVQGAGVEYLLPYKALTSQSDNGVLAQEESQANSENNSIDAAWRFEEEFALIPGYRIQVSAGHGCLNSESSSPVRYLAFRRKWLTYRGFNENDLAAVWAKGDSMEPTINNNDTLIVHLKRNRPTDGNLYIFRSGDELFVKRYQSVLGSWRLISDNLLYDKVDIKQEEQHNFEVIGQVVHISKDIGD